MVGSEVGQTPATGRDWPRLKFGVLAPMVVSLAHLVASLVHKAASSAHMVAVVFDECRCFAAFHEFTMINN